MNNVELTSVHPGGNFLTGEFMREIEDCAQKINEHHEQAHSKACEAMEHAKAAGHLLLQVKASIPHGEFTNWILANLKVSPRQAQRYMDIVRGKQVTVRQLAAKTDTMSVLETPSDQGSVIDGRWVPNMGFHYCYATDDAAYWVVPSSKDDGYHVSKLYQQERDPSVDPSIYADPDDPYDERDWDGISLYDGTSRPVPGKLIHEYFRIIFGIPDATSIVWLSFPGVGLERPFGEPASCSEDDPSVVQE